MHVIAVTSYPGEKATSYIPYQRRASSGLQFQYYNNVNKISSGMANHYLEEKPEREVLYNFENEINI